MTHHVQKRYLALDGLRGVAAIIVVLHHVVWTMGGKPMFVFGPLAVDFFFILSGFVISHAYGGRLASGTLSFGQFAKRRIVRLYPMIFAGALLGLSFHLLSANSDIEKLTFLQTTSSFLCIPFQFLTYGSRDFINPPAWSLFFELFASIAYGAVSPYLKTPILIASIIIAAVFLVFGELRFHTNQLGMTAENFPFGFARVIFSFGTGILLHRFHSRKAATLRLPAWFLAAGLIICMGMPNLARGEMPLNLISVLIAFPLMVLAGASSPEGGKRHQQILKFLGDISYPLYIIHWPVFWWFEAIVLPQEPQFDIRLYGIAATAIAICLAYGFLKLYDEPVRTWLSSKKSAA